MKNIIFEDKFIIVLDKPYNLVTMGQRGEDSLYSRTLLYLNKKKEHRLFAVHRLDKTTSGVVLFAKDKSAYEKLLLAFKKHYIKKEYVAITDSKIDELFTGNWKKEGLPFLKFIKEDGKEWLNITYPIHGIKTKSHVDVENGVASDTSVRIDRTNDKYTQLIIRLKTGRFHQIRTHLSFLGHPLVGDTLYGGPPTSFDRLFLHAREITFTHPISKKKLHFASKLPAIFSKQMESNH